MPKTVAEKTNHLSFRIDVNDRDKIEKIRKSMEARFGILPQRSDVLRKILDFGIEAFCKKNNIDLGPDAKKAEVRKRQPAAKASDKSVVEKKAVAT